ncbi:MAG: hypothetical protein ABFC57_07455 [Veillonellales bacterium]
MDYIVCILIILVFVWGAISNKKRILLYAYIILSPYVLLIKFGLNPNSIFLSIWQNIYLIVLTTIAFALAVPYHKKLNNKFDFDIMSIFFFANIIYGLIVASITLINGNDLIIAVKGFRDYYLIMLFYFCVIYFITEEKIEPLIRVMLYTALFNVVFTIIEAIYINYFSGIENLFWLNQQYLNTENAEGDYVQGIPIITSEINFRYIRPFGVIMQPQINSIFLLFTLTLLYIDRRVFLWTNAKVAVAKCLAVIALLISFGKTAIIIYFIILPLLYNFRRGVVYITIFILVFGIIALPFVYNIAIMFDLDSAYSLSGLLDLQIYTENNTLFTFLAGSGFEEYDSIKTAREVTFFRLLHYFGIFGLIIYILPFAYLLYMFLQKKNQLNNENRSICKVMLIIMLIYWLSTMHYNAFWTNGINTYYILAIFVCHRAMQSGLMKRDNPALSSRLD